MIGILLLLALGAVFLLGGIPEPEASPSPGDGPRRAEAAGLDPASSPPARRTEIPPGPGTPPKTPFPDACLQAPRSEQRACLLDALQAADDDSVVSWLHSQAKNLEGLELLFQALLQARPPGKALELAGASGNILQGTLTGAATESFLHVLRRRARSYPAFRRALYEHLRGADLLGDGGAADTLALSLFADDPLLRARAEEVALGAAGTPTLGQWRGSFRAATDPAAGREGLAFLARLLDKGKFLPPAAWRILPARTLARETAGWNPDRRLDLLGAFLESRNWGDATAFLIQSDPEHLFQDLADFQPEKFAALRKQASARLEEEE
ncbi:MAG: hypothetical protein ACE5H3_05160 [Planctomycetota bacterium]